MQIPLFPLRTVLFPGMTMPLRIFEERYKAMMRELLETDGQFGVLLIREGQEVGEGAVPFDVGTTAQIEQWSEVEGGRFVLSVRGVQRFRLLSMLPPRPYPFGEIHVIEDDNPPRTEQLTRAMETVRTVFPVYFRLALSLTDQWARGFRLPNEPHALVNFLAPWLQADEETRQRLLEIEPGAERATQLAETLDDLLVRLRESAAEYRRRKYLGLGSAN